MMTLQERVHSAPMPSGWKLDKLHQTLKVRRGNKNAGMREDNLLSLSYGRIIRKDIDTDGGLLPESFETYQVVEAGDIIMRLTDLQNDKRSLRQGLVKERGIITSAYDALEVVRDNEPRFWAYALLALDLAKYYYSLGGGVRQSVKFSDFPNEWIYRPDLPTQKRIAAVLDRETTRIDQLIAKKERFASMIGDREEALFLDAVTGRALQGPKQSSGVDWIGDLPEGWLAPKFTMVARQETGHTPSRKEPSYWVEEDCIIPWVSLADVWQLRSGETVYLTDSAEKISEFGMANSSARLLPKDTVILSRTASVGFCAIMAQPMATTQDFAAWICSPKIRPKFLYYVLRAMKPEFRRLMMGSTHQTIYMPDIRSFRTPLPPLPEQDRIITELDLSIGTYRKAQARTLESIKLLKESRSALITAAVTGQIDLDNYGTAGTPSATLDRIEEEMQA